LHFVCILKPLDKTINIDPKEIAECRWASFEEYFAMTHLEKLQMAVKDCVMDYVNGNCGLMHNFDVSQTIKNPATMYTTSKSSI
jgi:NADH pyrophosphatase NudC (nudix superfamily)